MAHHVRKQIETVTKGGVFKQMIGIQKRWRDALACNDVEAVRVEHVNLWQLVLREDKWGRTAGMALSEKTLEELRIELIILAMARK